MKIGVKIAAFTGLVGLLVLIRFFEQELFYDPFMAFFRGVDSGYPVKWYLNLVLRYVVNTLISLAIIYLLFQRLSMLKFAGLLYLAVLILLFPLFIFLMQSVNFEDYLSVFYVRRFLAHPLLLLLLLPAFYYQKLHRKQRSDL